jgi:ABC-2 type transport system ATP-binding protein
LITELASTADELVVIGRGRLLAAEPVATFAARAGSLEASFLALTAGSVEYSAGGAS